MKQIWIYTCAIGLMSLFACQQEELPSNNNVGYLSIENISIQSADVETITTRAVVTDLYVEIWDEEGTSQVGETYGPGNIAKIELEPGYYMLKAYNAAFLDQENDKGAAVYYADQLFSIEAGKVNYLSVEVPMTNIGVRLALPEGFSNWFNPYSFNVSDGDGNRSVSIDNGETVYFTTGEITYTLSATNNDEEEFQLEGSSSKWVNEENEKIIITPGTIYVITYDYATQSLQLLDAPTQQP